MRKRATGILLICTIIISLIPTLTSVASSKPMFSDIQGHWGQSAIERFVELGIVQGYRGEFKPDKVITRGELAIILDNVMDYQTKANNVFSDINGYYNEEAILKVYEANTMVGTNNLFRPNDPITREEAIVTFARVFGLIDQYENVLSIFIDSTDISAWAVEAVNSAVNRGYIKGYKNQLLLKNKMTRAEVVTILNNIIKEFYSTQGEYTSVIDGTAVINTDAVILRNTTIKGDLIVTEGVANGQVILDNVTVEGKAIVRGGGANSIIIKGNSRIPILIIDKTDSGAIRIKTEEDALVEVIYVNDGKDDIILTGQFNQVLIEGETTVKSVGAQIKQVEIKAQNTSLDVDQDTRIENIKIKESASAAAISNKGIIAKVNVEANGVIVLGRVPNKIEVDESVTIKPIDDKGNEVNTPPVEPYIPVIPDPAPVKDMLPSVIKAQIVIKSSDDPWYWGEDGVPIITYEFPEDESNISHYVVYTSKDKGEWIEDSIIPITEYHFLLGYEINTIDEAGNYQFKIKSVPLDPLEYESNEYVFEDTINTVITESVVTPNTIFTLGQDEVKIRSLETNEIYEVLLYDQEGQELTRNYHYADKGVITTYRYVDVEETQVEAKSINIRTMVATKTTTNVVEITMSHLANEPYPIMINNSPIDPINPEFGEYLTKVSDINLSLKPNQLTIGFMFPTDLSDFIIVRGYLFTPEGDYQYITNDYLDSNTERDRFAGKQREWVITFALLNLTKSYSFDKIGITSEPTETSNMLANIQYLDVTINVNVIGDPLTNFDATLSINDKNERQITVSGLEANKTYYLKLWRGNQGSGEYQESDGEGNIIMDTFNFDTLEEGATLFVQKFEFVTNTTNQSYTLNMTPASEKGVLVNLNGLKPLIGAPQVNGYLMNENNRTEDDPYDKGDLLIQWTLPYTGVVDIKEAHYFVKEEESDDILPLDIGYDYQTSTVPIDKKFTTSVTGLLRNIVDNGIYFVGVEIIAKEEANKDNNSSLGYNPINVKIDGNVVIQGVSTGTTTVATQTTVVASMENGKVVVDGLESDEMYVVMIYDSTGKELYFTHNIAVENSISFMPILLGDQTEVLFKIRKISAAKDVDWVYRYNIIMTPMPDDVISVQVNP